MLEILALRHQPGVRARSNRRFRAPDRLLWVILRRLWPLWERRARSSRLRSTVGIAIGSIAAGVGARDVPGRPRIDSLFEL